MIENLMVYADTAFAFAREPIFLGAALGIAIQLLVLLGGRHVKKH
jgi:hypothetical protein